jgi:death on curing protein
VPPRWQPSLEDYLDIAAYLLDADRVAIAKLPRITLAESALHAPFASFGGAEAHPTLVAQAAVLLEHLTRNHPLPDANKRAALLLMARFLDANGLQGDRPTST